MNTINATMVGCLFGALALVPLLLIGLLDYDASRAGLASLYSSSGVLGSWLALVINIRGGTQ